jgi:hypothetical protein
MVDSVDKADNSRRSSLNELVPKKKQKKEKG